MTTSLQSEQEYIADAARLLPHAIGPEKSVLSSMLKDPETYIGRAVEEGLTVAHFYLPAHATLFEFVTGLQNDDKEIELVSLVQLLHDRALLDHVGGPSSVTDIYTYAPNAAHFKTHLDLVKDKFVLREAIKACTAGIAEAYDQPEEVAQWLDSLESRILQVSTAAEKHETDKVKDLVAQVLTHLREKLEGKEDTRAIGSGFPRLDKMTKGLKPGEMFVIAARPAMGKTSLMMNMVEHVAIDLSLPTLVFSAEMTAFQLIERLTYARARFDISKVYKGFKPDKLSLTKLKRAGEEIASAPLYIDDTPALPIDTLRAKARRQAREHGIRLIAIDYLQLLRSNSKQAANSREREVGEISAGIKALAKELSIPIIVLAQLNRGPEARTGAAAGKPRMSDLRESGTIEQDADMIGLLYRAAYYAEAGEEDEVAGIAELVLAKNRNGETGHVPLTFLDVLMRFETRANDAE